MRDGRSAKKIDIRYLKGVGPKRAEILHRLGIYTIEDLLYYLPRRYEDRSNFTLIRDLEPGQYYTVKGKVIKGGQYITKRGINIFQIALTDGTGIIHCVWFNQPFLKKFFREGQEIVIYGKVEKYGKLQINHPEYEILEGKDTLNIGRIVPVYPLTQEVNQRYIRFLTHEAIRCFISSLKEKLPAYIRARRHLVDLRFAVRNIHFPVSFENLDRAYKRLVFEEFFILQLALALRKKNIKTEKEGIKHVVDDRFIDSFKKLFPFDLTKSQLEAIRQIERDMASDKPMNRLLEGDVGSGKTVVAIYAMLLTIKNGYQAALMAPTEILARQHYINISELLMPLGINVRLLISGLKPEKKLEIKKEIENGDASIVVGTHALIWEDVRFEKIGLVVIDEQHKFGVMQRQLLKTKGSSPDVLVMTATPIPRTLALTVYGDLDISVIRELPKGRYPVTTYCIEEAKREKVYQFVREEIKKGRQAYIVYPRIWSTSGVYAGQNRRQSRRLTKDSLAELAGQGRLKAAASMYHYLQEKIFPDLKLALMHGRMGTREKEKIMKDFADGKIDILVSTTVIEVGIDVANASVMIIENAERFGLSQLHQLRGRIGRGDYPSYCILLGSPKTEASRKRFYTISQTQDGFRVAEEDLHLRGPGEFFGTRQHGLPELRFGNLIKDFDIMEEARTEAFGLVRQDPSLEDSRNAPLREVLKERFAGRPDLANVG